MPEQKLIRQPEDISINTNEEIDQILGNPPSWMLQWGITIVLFVVLIFGTLAWLIKYPDIISAKVVLTTKQPVLPVMARANGTIKQLLVTNDQAVAKGDVLALLENPASYQDIRTLDSLLHHLIDNWQQGALSYAMLRTDLRLGTLQTAYASLVQQLRTTHYFLKQQDTEQKIHSLEAQIGHIKQLHVNLLKQQQTLQQEVQLARTNLKRNQQLHQDQIVSTVELEQVEATYLQIKRQLETTQNGIISNNITIEQLQTQVLDLQQSRNNTRSDQQLHILAAVDALRGAVKDWERTYLLKAPIDGQVSFSKVWSEQQFIQANAAVFSLVPSPSNSVLLGRAQLPIANSGKVKVGQRVNIQLDGFPYQEYGVVQGTVAHISLVPTTAPAEQTTSYLVEITVPSDLRTTYDKTLSFRPSMMGTANIVTENRRILVRVFDQLNSILRNGS